MPISMDLLRRLQKLKETVVFFPQEKVIDSSAKPSHFAIQSGFSHAYDDGISYNGKNIFFMKTLWFLEVYKS